MKKKISPAVMALFVGAMTVFTPMNAYASEEVENAPAITEEIGEEIEVQETMGDAAPVNEGEPILIADSETVQVGMPKEILFTCELSAPASGEFKLYREGKPCATMKDDGEGGDLFADDNTYSVSYTVTENEEGSVNYRAQYGDIKTTPVTISVTTESGGSDYSSSGDEDEVLSIISEIEKMYENDSYLIPQNFVSNLFEDITTRLETVKNMYNIESIRATDEELKIEYESGYIYTYTPAIDYSAGDHDISEDDPGSFFTQYGGEVWDPSSTSNRVTVELKNGVTRFEFFYPEKQGIPSPNISIVNPLENNGILQLSDDTKNERTENDGSDGNPKSLGIKIRKYRRTVSLEESSMQMYVVYITNPFSTMETTLRVDYPAKQVQETQPPFFLAVETEVIPGWDKWMTENKTSVTKYIAGLKKDSFQIQLDALTTPDPIENIATISTSDPDTKDYTGLIEILIVGGVALVSFTIFGLAMFTKKKREKEHKQRRAESISRVNDRLRRKHMEKDAALENVLAKHADEYSDGPLDEEEEALLKEGYEDDDESFMNEGYEPLMPKEDLGHDKERQNGITVSMNGADSEPTDHLDTSMSSMGMDTAGMNIMDQGSMDMGNQGMIHEENMQPNGMPQENGMQTPGMQGYGTPDAGMQRMNMTPPNMMTENGYGSQPAQNNMSDPMGMNAGMNQNNQNMNFGMNQNASMNAPSGSYPQFNPNRPGIPPMQQEGWTSIQSWNMQAGNQGMQVMQGMQNNQGMSMQNTMPGQMPMGAGYGMDQQQGYKQNMQPTQPTAGYGQFGMNMQNAQPMGYGMDPNA